MERLAVKQEAGQAPVDRQARPDLRVSRWRGLCEPRQVGQRPAFGAAA